MQKKIYHLHPHTLYIVAHEQIVINTEMYNLP